MALKSGDPIPIVCTPVGNVPFTMLSGVGGILQLEPGADGITGKLPFSDKKIEYMSQFSTRDLEVCEADRQFANLNAPLMVDVKIIEVGGGCYIVRTDSNDQNFVLAFTANVPTVPKVCRTKDGRLWTVYTLNNIDAGGSEIWLTYSVNNGVTWIGHRQVSTIKGDCRGPTIVVDTNDLLHIAWGQNDHGEELGIPNFGINVFYKTYNITTGTFGFEKVITENTYDFIIDKLPVQEWVSLCIDFRNNNIHCVFKGQGFNPPVGGMFADTLEHRILNNYGYSGLGTIDGDLVSYPSVRVDKNGEIHIIYSNDIDLYYFNSIRGIEHLATRASSTNLALIPTIYSDSTLHYEPYFVTSSSSNPLTEFLHTEEGWVSQAINSCTGEITGYERAEWPDERLILTVPNHGLMDGETVLLHWDGSTNPYWYPFKVIVIDENTIKLENSKYYNPPTGVSTGNWNLAAQYVSTLRDAGGNITVAYHANSDILYPNNGVYVLQGTPFLLEERTLLDSNTSMPSTLQLDEEDTGNYMLGYIVMTGYGVEPRSSFYRICLDIREPED